jgi:hypothetical protein
LAFRQKTGQRQAYLFLFADNNRAYLLDDFIEIDFILPKLRWLNIFHTKSWRPLICSEFNSAACEGSKIIGSGRCQPGTLFALPSPGGKEGDP